MKEREQIIGQDRLTRKSDASTLRSEGISMPEEGKAGLEPPRRESPGTGRAESPRPRPFSPEEAKTLWEGKSPVPWEEVPTDIKAAVMSGVGTRTSIEDRFGFYLQPEDISVLKDEPIEWLNDQFNILYRSVQEGQELTSPVINNLQTVASEAIRYLQYHNPEKLDEFQTLFIQRLNLMSMRTTIGYRNIGAIKESSIKLTAHGLMSGFGMEDGKVASMFNRLNELLEDQRVRVERGHVTPEIVNKLQETVIQEQVELAEKGLSDFGDLSSKTTKVERQHVIEEIRRSVRIAYDTFVDSQRQGIIVARGRTLLSTEGYFSDPSSGPLNVYNLEALLTEKFDILNQHDHEFLDRIKLDMAEGYLKEARGSKNLSHQEKIDLGRRLFRDLFAVPDFFSSGWRIEGIVDSIEERMIAIYGEKEGKEKAEEMALFLRLRETGTSAKDKPEEKREIWEKVAKFRPEEIVRLFRERGQDTKDLKKRYNELFTTGVFTRNGITNYDQFKDKYGVIIRKLREDGYKEFRQLKIAEKGFTADERKIINKFIGSENAADELREMYRQMTAFSKDSIEDLLTHNKFEDIYTRTIDADDALLDELEKSDLVYKGRVVKRGFTPLSKKWAADQGGDALVRNWNDTENAVKAAQALVEFIKQEGGKEKLKAAMEFAEATSHYNGQSGRAKALRYTFGTFLKLSKKDYIFDVIGFNKGPFRKAISEIERIYGPSAQPKSRQELRAQLDEVSLILVAQLKKSAREGLITPKEYKEEVKKAQLMYEDLEEALEVTGGDAVKLAFLQLLLYLLLETIAVEPYKLAQSVAKGKAA